MKVTEFYMEDCGGKIPDNKIDFSGNQTVQSVWVDNMSLTELNLSNCTSLAEVVPGYSQMIVLATIDLRNCTGITETVDFSMVNEYSNCTVYIYGSSLAGDYSLYTNTGTVTIDSVTQP